MKNVFTTGLVTLLIAAAFAAWIPAVAVQNTPAVPPEITLTILHDNDLHGHLLPFAYTETGIGKEEMPSVGGAARRATLVRKLRKDSKNPILLLDTGDTFTRGPLANTYEGIPDTEAMNAIGYDLAALGNNEFKAKDGVDQTDAKGAQDALLQVIKRSRFPWVCANATDSRGAFLEGVQPYVVRNMGGVRVGFLGLTAPRSASYPQTRGWTISDPIASAQTWIPEARKHCDVLIAVTHIGVDLDKKLASQTTGLDAIVGGDSHTFLYQAEEAANPNGEKIPIVQDGEFGVRLGRLDLHFGRDAQNRCHLARYEYALLPINDKLSEAKDVQETLAPYVGPLLTVIGHLDTIGKTPQERSRQSTQLLVNALQSQTGADAALNPDGDSFFDGFRHKNITRYDLLAARPFHDNVVLATLTGAEIKALIAAQPKTIVSENAAGKQWEADKTYQVALIDFTAQSTYKLPASKFKDTGRDERDVMTAYFASGGK